MKVQQGQIVTIQYTLRDAAGTLLESSEAQGPISFKLGADPMLPGLEKIIEEMEIGERREGSIAPGALVPAAQCKVREIGFDEFPGALKPSVGDRFQAKGPNDQPVIFEVFERDEKGVKVRILHALHDTEVFYEVEVEAARKANIPPPAPVDVPDMTAALLEG